MDSFLSFKILVDEVQIHQSLCMCPKCHLENGKVTPLKWSPVWCLPQRLRCQSQYKRVFGK